MEEKEFKVISREVTGEVFIKADSQFNNINATYVTVGENVTARLYGIIKKKLVLKKGSVLYMHGHILGTIENEGGKIHIYNKD
jgi:hypothetical protein